ncbi:alpha/beta hydrolase [Amycolatopsis sp., V23-08]|uniref:Alpha/beta hydrolase n=1 Tax=Amycolatopsis heterodermiae TaxID=3110235 RepID=A0ABU5R4M6_9PSEU|nr:alpha/beta hydrolase [Amycolatopsis sp., V23-08]MEA5361147.1 alpha/beta hydrolase [Amycolatopsis sp., V23-08]
MSTHTVRHEGAELTYDLRGSGPLLLLIAGQGGEGARFAGLARQLADEFTVLTYDRRGTGRSAGRDTDFDMAQQARDAAAVIHSARPAAARAAVFGQGGGGSIAFELAAHLPDVVAELVVHEAPSIPLLPDAPQRLAFAREIRATYESRGAAAALALWGASPADFPRPEAADHFLRREFLPIAWHHPDLDAVRRTGIPVVTATGAVSREEYYTRGARVQAEHLACRCVEFPGDHFGFVAEPALFADVLTKELTGLRRA